MLLLRSSNLESIWDLTSVKPLLVLFSRESSLLSSKDTRFSTCGLDLVLSEDPNACNDGWAGGCGVGRAGAGAVGTPAVKSEGEGLSMDMEDGKVLLTLEGGAAAVHPLLFSTSCI